MLYLILLSIFIQSRKIEVGIYKRKQESKKKRKKERKQELDQKSDQEKRKNFLFFS